MVFLLAKPDRYFRSWHEQFDPPPPKGGATYFLERERSTVGTPLRGLAQISSNLKVTVNYVFVLTINFVYIRKRTVFR